MTSLCSTMLSNYNCSHGEPARFGDCDGFVNLEKLEHNQHIGATGPWNGREETGGRGNAPGGNWIQKFETTERGGLTNQLERSMCNRENESLEK